MSRYLQIALVFSALFLLVANTVIAGEYEKASPPRKLTDAQAKQAASNYQKYCSLCHGKNREGYANDHAPSLKSKTLFETGIPHAVLRPLSYGREGTAMGGYLDEVGGPLSLDETWDLTYWLFWQAGVERLKLGTEPVVGDKVKGAALYKKNCTACHGVNGEGVNAPALFNQSALAHNSDEFIRYTIAKGRQNTPMVAYEKILSEDDIDNLTAFIRSRDEGGKLNKAVLRGLPKPQDYIINPDGDDPNFKLDEGIYVSSKNLYQAMKDKRKMVLLDTRVPSVWQTAHIEGSVPVPYYYDADRAVQDLPKDVQIVAYCSCPRASAEYVVKKLRSKGYKNTAVLYEGIFGWQNFGYPLVRGETE